MPKTVEYTGTVRPWPELAITGKQSVWYPGQTEERSDTEAAKLLATGLFFDQSSVQLPDSKVAAISAPGIPGAAALSATDYLTNPVSWPAPSSAAVSTTAVVSQVSSVVTPDMPMAARTVWLDLKVPVGAVTDGTAIAAGAVTIPMGAAGTGAFYPGDEVAIAGQNSNYILKFGDGDVSNGGSLTLEGQGLRTAIGSGAGVAITLVKRGVFAYIAANCDNDREGLLRSQDPATRDASVRLGEAVVLRSNVPLSILHMSASTSVLANAARFETVFGK